LFETGDEEPGAELAAPGLEDRDEERRRLEVIRGLALRAQAAESKMGALIRLLRRAHEPAIVFTEYRDTLARLVSLLAASHPTTLHGGLTPAERRENLQRFTSGAARLLLATDAASEGLNLHQHCRLVINLELPWTPLRLEQRIGRVERIGQTRRVHAVHLRAVDTTEESYLTTLSNRTERAADASGRLRERPPILTPIRATAEAETMRLEQLRRLSEPAGGFDADGRPPITVVRKRSGRCASLWGFHLSFADSTAQHLWRTLIGAATSSLTDSPVPIDSIDRVAPELATKCDGDRERAAASLEAALRAFRERASLRERAIARTIDGERARLSASLLQRGLFDRRAERAFNAQTAVLDEALARCHTRLAEIESTGQIVAEPARLAFALLRG
jgi:superfamily II DNA or RNA helicase